jgi:hypothetical protein
MGWMQRWQADAQRKGDLRAARWVEHQHQKALTGQLTVMDRWAARAQRKGDYQAARWVEIEPLYRLLRAGAVAGPSGSTAVIYVGMSGDWLLSRPPTKHGTLVPTGAPGGAVVAAYLLITLAIWWVVFRRSYTVHVHINGGAEKVHVRLPSELAACHAAVKLIPRFQAEGPAAVESWRADVLASKNAPETTATPAGH